MIFNILIFFTTEVQNPVLLIPGAFRSRLRADIDSSTSAKWYCPKRLENEMIWLNPKLLLPPFLNCFLQWMNASSGAVYPEDFGGLNGVESTGEIFGLRFLRYYDRLIDRLCAHGYTKAANIRSAPYDWRYGTAQPEQFFADLQRVIEEEYIANNGTKVAIIAHSLGTQIAHHFLTERTTKEWRKKYVNSCTLVAPSFSGAGFVLGILWRMRSGGNSTGVFQSAKDFLRNLGALHVHIPHSLGYQNTTLLIDKYGNRYSGSELIDFLNAHNVLTQRELDSAEKNFYFVRKWPEPLDVDTNVLYNSGFKTPLGINLQKRFRFITVPGDGLVGSDVIDWICRNWGSNNITLNCKDWGKRRLIFSHPNLIRNRKSIDVILDWIVGNERENSNHEL